MLFPRIHQIRVLWVYRKQRNVQRSYSVIINECMLMEYTIYAFVSLTVIEWPTVSSSFIAIAGIK